MSLIWNITVSVFSIFPFSKPNLSLRSVYKTDIKHSLCTQSTTSLLLPTLLTSSPRPQWKAYYAMQIKLFYCVYTICNITAVCSLNSSILQWHLLHLHFFILLTCIYKQISCRGSLSFSVSLQKLDEVHTLPPCKFYHLQWWGGQLLLD